MTKYHYIFPILLTLFVSSCVSIDQLSIDYLQPAKVNFPSTIKTVGILNNTITKNEKIIEEKRDSFNRLISNKATFQGNARITTESFAKNIVAANYFDQVIICDSALREKDHFPRDPELTGEEVKQLTSDLGVDILFSVEDIIIKTSKKSKNQDFLIHTTIDASVAPLIRVYIPTRTKPLLSAAPEDQIFWEGYGKTLSEANNDLIKEDSLIKECSEFAGELPIKYLLPTWNTSNRYYYTSGSVELRDGAVLIRENSWDDALKLWQLANNQKSKKIQMRTAFNIALYYEMHDDIEKAVEWAEKANKIVLDKENKKKKPKESKKPLTRDNYSEDYILTTQYLMVLKERMNNSQTLKMQMERFNDNF
ncbi:DUF6340 family protein [uncultured Bacteroides sp.]|uniref:DUF6340 family protein n=1 Tax=uncultured Bacteroides sp. TaxID=162156 RepID=UPI002AABF118|nr:DUF6340 family protein [uncultured Bacteroides sp.]